MADRVSASIELGGTITSPDYLELARIIAEEGLSVEWDAEIFEPDHRSIGQSLSLYAHEVAWGRFDTLEAWCVEKGLPFARWSGGCSGQFGAERVVFTGAGVPKSYAADEDDYIVINRATAKRLGSLEAIIAYFNAADTPIPPLAVDTDESAAPQA